MALAKNGEEWGGGEGEEEDARGVARRLVGFVGEYMGGRCLFLGAGRAARCEPLSPRFLLASGAPRLFPGRYTRVEERGLFCAGLPRRCAGCPVASWSFFREWLYGWSLPVFLKPSGPPTTGRYRRVFY